MKKLGMIFLAAALLLPLGFRASAQISIGAGPAARMFFNKGHDVSTIFGVQVSFEDCYRVSDVFGFSAGLDFGTYKKKDFFITGNVKQGLSEMYLDVPVRLKLYIPFSDDFQLFFFAGPVPSVCIGSHVLFEKEKVSRFGDNATYTRFDVLAGGGLGFEIGEHFKLAVGYDHGLKNRSKTAGANLHVAAAKVTASFMF